MHIMIDLETLDTSPSSVILSIGACAFEPAIFEPGRACRPIVHEHGTDDTGDKTTFYLTVNINDQMARDRTTSAATELWWAEQSEQAQAVLTSAATSPHTLREALLVFSDWLITIGADPRSTKMWGNGANFDNAIMSHAYAATGIKQPWAFWNDRCFRTLKALGMQPSNYANNREGTHHNALDDAVYQARAASVILGYLDYLKGSHKNGRTR